MSKATGERVRQTQEAMDKKLQDASAALDKATSQITNALSDPKVQAQLGFAPGEAAASRPQRICPFRRPGPRDRTDAVKETVRELDTPTCFCNLDEIFKVIPLPEPGEWLDQHKETGQNVWSFSRLSTRIMPHHNIRVIELVPLGPFEEGRAPSLDYLCRYVEAFFGCMARVAKPVKFTDLDLCTDPKNPRCPRRGMEGQLQISTNDIFDFLQKRRPAQDVLCSVAITMADIFPVKDGSAWNFVFGQARLKDGIGCYSFARYDPGGFPFRWQGPPSKDNYQVGGKGGKRSVQPLSDAEMSVMLRRSCKVMTHETGHIFGMKVIRSSASFPAQIPQHLWRSHASHLYTIAHVSIPSVRTAALYLLRLPHDWR